MKSALAPIAVILALCCVGGNMDKRDEELLAQMYCAKVHAGEWPDYKGTYRDTCKNAPQ